MALTNEHCDVGETLRQAGLSQTNQRMAVLRVMMEANGPLSASEILNRTQAVQQINRVTVYRILSSFSKHRIIRELPTDQGMNLYEIACRHNPIHPHFYCKSCRTVSCLPPLIISWAINWFRGPDTFRIEEVLIHLNGVCRKCQESS